MSKTTRATSTDSPDVDIPGRLNLGCGPDYREEWHNVDATPGVDPDEVVDLNDPWPWPDNSFQEILASHVFEHLDDTTHAMQEASRVLAPGGQLEVRVPIGRDAATDPTHQQTWTYDTPTFYDRDDGPPWVPDTGLTLEDRTLRVWFDGLLMPFDGLLQRLARRDPYFAEALCVAGELVAIYRSPDGGETG